MNLICIVLMSLLAGLGLVLLYHEGLLRSMRAWIVAASLLLVSLGGRLVFFDYETLDYINFLSRWAAYFRDYGGFLALRRQTGNYNIPYLYFLALFSYIPVKDLYLIKFLSVLFDVLLAWSCVRLAGHFTKSAPRLLGCFFTVLLLPTVFLNGAVWGQCDSLYVMPLVLGIELALSGKPKSAMILAALAFGMKLQAVFVLPIFAVIWMRGGKYKLWHFLLFPLSYVILVLPAVLLGRPFLETLTLYASQTGSIGSGLNYNSPSVFAIFWNVSNENVAAGVAIGAAFLFLLNMLGVAWVNRRHLTDRAVLGMALMLAIGIPFLLPHMHERYFYAADILSLVMAFAFPAFIPAALLVQIASLLGYYAYLTMRYLVIGNHLFLMYHGSAALIIAFALALICFLQGVAVETPRRKKE